MLYIARRDMLQNLWNRYCDSVTSLDEPPIFCGVSIHTALGAIGSRPMCTPSIGGLGEKH